MVDSGPFAQVLLALTTAAAVKDGALLPQALHGFDAIALRTAIEAGTQQRYELYLSRKLWSRVNAAPAWIALPAIGAATVEAPALIGSVRS